MFELGLTGQFSRNHPFLSIYSINAFRIAFASSFWQDCISGCASAFASLTDPLVVPRLLAQEMLS